jgi:hypothetical protein
MDVVSEFSREAAESAVQLRAVLAEVEAGELTCSTAERRRIEGAAIALETQSREADQ